MTNAAHLEQNATEWEAVCQLSDLTPMIGARALINNEQVALFLVKEKVYAISAIDPFTKTAVLSRGIVGDLNNELVVASPIYKQHFSLSSGKCLEDESMGVKTYPVRVTNGSIELGR